MLTVMVVMGTRPEVIKMAPVVHRLRRSPDVNVRVIMTGQHKELLVGLLDLFELQPETDLAVMEQDQSVAKTAAAVLARMDTLLREQKPDVLLVQGDTTTAFAAAAAAFFHRVPVGHVEAGLRTDDKFSPFPEEINRRWISVVGDFHFVPTQHARENLLREGHQRQDIYVTGNTVIDALLYTADKLEAHPPAVPALKERPFILVTVHRRENHGEPLARICDAILEIVRRHPDFDVVLPVHANPNVQRVVRGKLQHPQVRLVEPLDYLSFVDHMRSAHLLLTDSGGVQEEGPAFAKPILVMREKTERPEGLQAGTSELVGADPAAIVARVSKLITDRAAYASFAAARNPYGDGLAADRIANILGRAFSVPSLQSDIADFEAAAPAGAKA